MGNYHFKSEGFLAQKSAGNPPVTADVYVRVFVVA